MPGKAGNAPQRVREGDPGAVTRCYPGRESRLAAPARKPHLNKFRRSFPALQVEHLAAGILQAGEPLIKIGGLLVERRDALTKVSQLGNEPGVILQDVFDGVTWIASTGEKSSLVH